MMSDCASPVNESIVAPKASGGLTRIAVGLLVLGLLLSGVALAGDADRIRFGFGYIWGFSFLWVIVLGSLFFVGLQHLTGAIWSVVVRRVAEMFAASMWLVGILFLPVMLFVLMPDSFHVFPWADAEKVRADPLLSEKQAYLNVPFFVIRAAAFFGLWILFARYFVNTSLAQDRGADSASAASSVGSAVRTATCSVGPDAGTETPRSAQRTLPGACEVGEAATVSMRKWSAPFVMIFAFTATFAGFDWLMSLDPYWFSTIFGVYIFSGMVLASLASVTIATVKLRDAGRLGSGLVTDEHLYSLGALLFAFTCFWAYIAFSQYMLIWYANIPEETSYLFRRLEGDWLGVSIALAVVRFALPFFLLLSRHAKMNPRILVWASVLILVGQLLDLYWLIMPELHREGPVLGWQELGPLLLVVGALMLFVSRFLGRHAPIAIGDPLYYESLRFRL